MIPPCLTLSIIRYESRVKWSNPGKGVAIENGAFGSPSTTVTNFYFYCQKIKLIQYKLDQFHSTVSASECNDLKEQSLKDIRKLDIGDSIKEISQEFWYVFEKRFGEFEGKLTLQTEPETVPIQQPIRSVTFEFGKQFKQELEKMMKDSSSWLKIYVIERKQRKAPDMFRLQIIKPGTG